MEVKYRSLEFYLNTAKRAIGKWGHLSMLSSEDCIADVAYCIMIADGKFNGKGNIRGYRMQCAHYGILNLMTKYKKRAMTNVLSLDARGINDNPLYNYIEDKKPSIIDEIEMKTTEELVLSFDFITQQEKNCIIKYYLNKETLREIGENLNLTRERIRQIIESGLTKLRRYYKSR